MKYDYIENFKKLGFGMFNHFGLHSILGKGEWALKFNCNFLLNTGMMGNGLIPEGERFVLEGIGKWISVNKSFIYNSCGTDILADNADIFYDGEFYYAVIKKVPMRTNANVANADNKQIVTIKTDEKIVSAKWLDNGKRKS